MALLSSIANCGVLATLRFPLALHFRHSPQKQVGFRPPPRVTRSRFVRRPHSLFRMSGGMVERSQVASYVMQLSYNMRLGNARGF